MINISLEKAAVVKVLIYNANAQLVYQQEKSKLRAGSNTLTINTGTLPDGIYTYKLIIDDGSHFIGRMAVLNP